MGPGSEKDRPVETVGVQPPMRKVLPEERPSLASIRSSTSTSAVMSRASPLEELVQLLLEALHHLVHHALDAFHGGGDVLPVHLLVLQLGVSPENFQGGGQVVAQKLWS